MIYVMADYGHVRSSCPVEMKKMPGGELHPTIPSDVFDGGQEYVITADTRSTEDLFAILVTHNALKRNCPGKPIHLNLGYVPYARQDRVGLPGEALSIEAMADFINMMNFQTVTIVDPHSDVTTALIKNAVVVTQEEIIKGWLVKKSKFEDYGLDPAEYFLVAPDAGAVKKTDKIAQACGFRGVVYAAKQRDIRTGKIEGTVITHCSVSGENYKLDDLSGGKFLVIDDICDGGFTFIQLANALRRAVEPSDLRLFVTHGLFTKGTDILKRAGYDRIYCTNSYGLDNWNVDYGFFNKTEVDAANVTIFREVRAIR